MDVFRRFKELADMKKTVTDADLEALVADEAAQKPEDHYRLVDIQVVCGTMGMPTATVKMLNQDGEELVVSAVGTGPVDASYRAVDADRSTRQMNCSNSMCTASPKALTRSAK